MTRPGAGLREVAIVSPLRTPVGKFGGALKDLKATELGALLARAILERTGLDGARLDDCILGQAYPGGEEPCAGRLVALMADLPETLPGSQVDRRCGSGLQAVIDAALRVQTGNADVILAGGVESMSNVEYYSPAARWGAKLGHLELCDRLLRSRVTAAPLARFGPIDGMIETAENVAKKYAITRAEQDAYALRSQRRACEAWRRGAFAQEVVSVPLPGKKGEARRLDRDEGLREDATIEGLAALKPIQSGGTVTAGNASQQSDAAALCLVVAADKLKELRLEPLGYLRGWSVVGLHPAYMGLGPVPALQRLSARTGVDLKDIDLVELNEAFAAQVLGVLQGWGWTDRETIDERLNVNGSGISLGHPIGATGCRLVVTLLHELARRGGRYGLATLCIGGGQGIAALFERG